jgi:precorrin-2 dehydrogenase/sirohydrochlorin ferrochelatase
MNLSEYYPVTLHLKGKKVIVIGGGTVGTRKVRALLRSQAKITVISPAITPEIKEWINSKQIYWLEKSFTAEDISDGFLIVAATNINEVNEAVFQAVNPYQLFNRVDHPDQSNFSVPSSFRRGKLIVSVSTSGASPGLARRISNEISNDYDSSYEAYVEFLDHCRARVLEEIEDAGARRHIFKEILDPSYLNLTHSHLIEERNERFLELLRQSKQMEANHE